MPTLEKKQHSDHLNPSFSSTLLDQIYRSIDEGERKSTEMRFYRDTTNWKKQSRSNGKPSNRTLDKEQKMQKDKKDHDQDVMFFSSTSISSESSSGGFSSSDTESMCGARSRASCFAGHVSHRPKPVRTSTSFRSEKHGMRVFDGLCHSSNTEGISIHDDESLIKSKSRALRIYNNLKKVKHPISPGGKLTNFLNSLFTTNAKKTRSTYEDVVVNSERKAKSCQASMCSSVSSFSRSCLSKSSSSEREKLSNGVKRTVRFYPVSIIVDEDSRPCGHKRLYGEEGKSVKIGRSKKEEEEAAREFFGEYRHTQKKNNDLVFKDLCIRTKSNDNEIDHDDGDDDAASCASSDLFELDHLAVLGNGRYCEELPVYETTNVSTNRAIANGLIV